MARRKKSAKKSSEPTWVSKRLQLSPESAAQPTDPEVEKSAAEMLGLKENKRERFYKALRKIAVEYFLSLHQRAVPTDAEQAAHLRKILKTVRNVQRTIDKLPISRVLYMKYPFWIFRYQPSLNGRDLQTLPEYLRVFIPACERKIHQLRGRPGARAKDHMAQAVAKLVRIWIRYTGRRFPRSFDTELHHLKTIFTSNAAQFVFIAVSVFDADVTLAEVGVALRAALGKHKVKKSPREQG